MNAPRPVLPRMRVRGGALHGLILYAVLAFGSYAEGGTQVAARLEFGDREIPFFRVTWLRVVVEGPSAAEIALAPWAPVLAGLSVRPRDPVVTPAAGGRKTVIHEFTLAPVHVASYELPAVTVMADGAVAATLEAGTLNVRAPTPEEEAEVAVQQPLESLADLEGGAPEQTWLLSLLAVAVLSALALGGALVFRRAVSFPRHTPSPFEVALQALDELERAVDSETISCDPAAVLLSGILRDYLEHRFGVAARECSTPEFVAGPLTTLPISAEWRKNVRELLASLDRVKFARYAPDREERLRSVASVRELVRALESPPAAPATLEARGAA